MLPKDLSPYIISDFSTLKGKRVVVRLDLNLPHTGTTITDTIRLDAVIPFIKQLSFAGAKIVLLSHFGEEGESIEPVARMLTQKLSGISFCAGTDISTIKSVTEGLALGDGIIIENTRLFTGEIDNLPSTGEAFASLGDIFINDAFSVSHREHASIVGIPNYMLSYFGPTFVRECEHLSQALNPEKPALLILGGAKISTKLALIKRYLDQGVHVFVGGALAHNLLKERENEIGASLYDPNYKEKDNISGHPLLSLPVDVLLSTHEEVKVTDVPRGGVIVDCGKETLKQLDGLISQARTIIVNGPLGLYEKGWLYGTEHMLTSVSSSTTARTYLGGGDTIAVAENIHITKHIGYISLGGGAMLDFLTHGTLPGIDAVTKSHLIG